MRLFTKNHTKTMWTFWYESPKQFRYIHVCHGVLNLNVMSAAHLKTMETWSKCRYCSIFKWDYMGLVNAYIVCTIASNYSRFLIPQNCTGNELCLNLPVGGGCRGGYMDGEGGGGWLENELDRKLPIERVWGVTEGECLFQHWFTSRPPFAVEKSCFG